MEIPKAWAAQSFVAGKPVGSEFSTSEVTQSSPELATDPASTLDRMKCLDKVHSGTRGRFNHRDPNRYVRARWPGVICDKCPYGQSGSSGCVIQSPQMLVQVESLLNVEL